MGEGGDPEPRRSIAIKEVERLTQDIEDGTFSGAFAIAFYEGGDVRIVASQAGGGEFLGHSVALAAAAMLGFSKREDVMARKKREVYDVGYA